MKFFLNTVIAAFGAFWVMQIATIYIFEYGELHFILCILLFYKPHASKKGKY